jgi:hypothetical protein
VSDWDRFWQLLQYVGVPSAMAMTLVYALTKGWLVPGWLYQEEKARARKWEQRALESLRLASDAVTVADGTLHVAAGEKKRQP